MSAQATAETIEIHSADRTALRADVLEPARGKLRGVCVLAHAMFARRTQFERPRGKGLARFLAERGWRTIAFDFRGHGDSGVGAAKGGSWTYDDLVNEDLPAVVACARARAKRLPVIVIGHSLGGHVALASQGIGALQADAIVCFAANVWLEKLEPSPARWLAKRALLTAVRATCEARGYFPARALRLGSDDESRGYFAAYERFARTGLWGSDDGAHDYIASLRGMRAPLMQITSETDRMNCHPTCAVRFAGLSGGPVTIERVRQSDDGSAAPGHMELVTTDAALSTWERMVTWMGHIG